MKKAVVKRQTHVRPPWRWVGGKGRLLGSLEKFIPETFDRYYEPFLGGGAMFFAHGHRASECYLSDICKPLILTLEQLQLDFHGVWTKLIHMHDEAYNDVRFRFNAMKSSHFPDSVEAAAHFITLMHCGFNGVYRENSKGDFNVPQGKKGAGGNAKPITLASLTYDELWKPAALLDGVQLACCSFTDTPAHWSPPGPGSFVFYDSPYLAEFSQYNQDGFGEAEHRQLYAQAQEFAQRGARVVLCNSSNALTRSIFGEPAHVVQVERTVGNSLRGTATEAIYVFGP